MADIVLKDCNGDDVAYENVTSILLNTVGGGTQVFSEGVGGNFKFATGTIKTANAISVKHDLGVVPDIIVVQLSGMAKGCLYYATWFSPTLCASIGASRSPALYAYIDSTTGKDFYSSTSGNAPAIRDVTSNYFTVGSATYPAASIVSGILLYSSTWYAISFLN